MPIFWSWRRQAAEKLAEREPPPEMAMPMKNPEGLRWVEGRVVLARVWLGRRDSSGVLRGLSGWFLLVQLGVRSRSARRMRGGGSRGGNGNEGGGGGKRGRLRSILEAA